MNVDDETWIRMASNPDCVLLVGMIAFAIGAWLAL